MNTKIKRVSQLANTKFISLYNVEFKNKLGKDGNWSVASRKNLKDLEEIYLNGKEDRVDAVGIVAIHKDSEKMVIIKQFRVPINKYIYELPAGLIDNEEEIEESVRRELKEETGLNLVEILGKTNKLYLSPGMTDESISLVYCICDGEISKEFLEDDEDIEAMLISREEARQMLNSDTAIDARCYLMLNMFIEKIRK
jgi:ADP-ribose pyrophosphatase